MVAGAHVIELVASWAVTTALTFAVVLFDERRSSEERLERAWLPTTRTLCIVYLGVLALPFHFAKTRGHFGSWRGVLGRIAGFFLGVAVAVAVALVSGFVVMGVDLLLGIPIED